MTSRTYKYGAGDSPGEIGLLAIDESEERGRLSKTNLYPLQFEPIFQYRLWGGRRLADLLSAPLPADGLIGEAWVLSDRDDHSSLVASGPLKGQTIAQLLEHSREEILGRLARRFRRFPLLLKFLDVREMLSVQVHPSDTQTNLLPAGETGKTEAWVVLEAGSKSRIYAGLKPGTNADDLRQAIKNKTIADDLVCFTPKPEDGVFLPAGTVHSLGDGVVVFEVQENSDVTFRLYDWDHIDAKTSGLRPLQVDQALASINFADGAAGLVRPVLEATGPVAVSYTHLHRVAFAEREGGGGPDHRHVGSDKVGNCADAPNRSAQDSPGMKTCLSLEVVFHSKRWTLNRVPHQAIVHGQIGNKSPQGEDEIDAVGS